MHALEQHELLQIVSEAAESMAFMLVDETDEASLDYGDPTACASISLSGEASGIVRIEAFGEFADEFARGLTGVEEGEAVDEQALREALGELVNTLGETVVRHLGGADRRIKLGLPEHHTPAIATKPDTVVVVSSDLGGLRIAWHTNQASRAAA